MGRFRELRASGGFVLVAMCLSTFTDNFVYSMVIPILPYLLMNNITSSDEIQQWTSILLAAYGAALLVASPLVGLISDRIQSRKSPLIFGYIAIAVSTSVFLFGHSPALLIIARVCQDREESLPPLAGEEAPLLPPKDGSKASLHLRDFVDMRFMTAVLSEITISSILAAFETTLPLFTMEAYKWSSTNAGLVFLGISLPSFLSIPLSRYGRDWKRRRTIAIELILAFFPLVALRITDGPSPSHQIGFIALVTGAGLFLTTSQAQVMAEVSDAVREIEVTRGVDPNQRSGMGTGYAFCNMAIAIGQFVGPLIAGYARLYLGWGGMTLVLGGTSAFIGLLSLIVNP
ncbi:hypothetical protein E8E15_008528 [Penicillium rubens]|uniref:Putative MFS-type transporter n=1 Tax=Penicillium chrysogenum TaxID=5076 RepID=A0A167YLP3_PENCH|nr:hypothetical protein E8E15_008528 [Penicillium rubens]KZN94281.1 putative MFS-type transporter [Penicillium chrysogenum]